MSNDIKRHEWQYGGVSEGRSTSSSSSSSFALLGTGWNICLLPTLARRKLAHKNEKRRKVWFDTSAVICAYLWQFWKVSVDICWSLMVQLQVHVRLTRHGHRMSWQRTYLSILYNTKPTRISDSEVSRQQSIGRRGIEYQGIEAARCWTARYRAARYEGSKFNQKFMNEQRCYHVKWLRWLSRILLFRLKDVVLRQWGVEWHMVWWVMV